MDEQEIPVSEARKRLAELCRRASEEGARFVLTRRGRRVAVLAGPRDLGPTQLTLPLGGAGGKRRSRGDP